MQSKKSFFSKAIIRKNITRFWPLWAVYLFVWFLILPYEIIVGDNGMAAKEILLSSRVVELCGTAVPLVAFVYSIIVAVAVFGYMNSTKSVGFYHSMPLSRETLYISNFASGIVFICGPNILITILTVIGGWTSGCNIASAALTWLYCVTCVSVLFFSMGAICGTLTGHSVVQPVLYVIVNFLVVVVESVVRGIGGLLLFGVGTLSKRTLAVLSPMFKLLRDPVTTVAEYGDLSTDIYTMENWALLGLYLAAGVIIAACGLFIYRRRRSEAAGDIVAVKWLKPVFKYCLSFGMAITMGLVLFSLFTETSGSTLTTGGVFALTAWMVIMAIVGYIAGEMLIKKTLRVFTKSCFVGIGVVTAVIVAANFLTHVDILGIEDRIPDADDIQNVYINENAYFYDADSGITSGLSEVLALHKMIIADKKEITASDNNPTFEYNDQEHYMEKDNFSIRLTYVLKNGSSLTRSYYGIPVTEEEEKDDSTVPGKYLKICNEKEQILRRLDLAEGGEITYAYITGGDEDFNLDNTQAQALYRAVLKDGEQGGIGKIWIINGKEHNDIYYENYISIEYEVKNEAKTEPYAVYSSWLGVELTKDSVNTLAVMEEMGYPMTSLRTVAENERYHAETRSLPSSADEHN